MLPRTQSEQFGARDTHSLVWVTRTLEEAREILRGFEETALAGAAAQLSADAESLAEAAEILYRIRPGPWVDREGIRAHLARANRGPVREDRLGGSEALSLRARHHLQRPGGRRVGDGQVAAGASG